MRVFTPKQNGRFRFSLARSMIAIAVFAFGCLILRQSLKQSLSVTLLVWWAGLLPLVFCHGSAQAFWAGFVFFGWFRSILVLPFYDQHYDLLTRLHAAVAKRLGSSTLAWDASWQGIELVEMLLFAVTGGLLVRWYYKKTRAATESASKNNGDEVSP